MKRARAASQRPSGGDRRRGRAGRGTGLGHGRRPGVERQPVAGRRQDHPAAGLDQRPGQPEPVHRLRVVQLRDLGDQLRAAGRDSGPSDYANVPASGWPPTGRRPTTARSGPSPSPTSPRWQDGEPLTAKDVAFTYNYMIDNDLGMFIDYMKFIEQVEAPDATHVVFTCSKPKANMLGLWIPILPEHIWSKVSPKEVENKFKNPPPIIGSGPFQTVEWKKGEYVRLVANKDYWRGAPKVDEVIFQTYQNQDTMAQDLKTGAIQSGLEHPVGAGQHALDNEPDLEAIRAVTIGFDQLGFNCADKKNYPKSTGHPGASGPRVPQRAPVGHRQGQDRRPSATAATPLRPTPSSPRDFYTATRTTTGRRRPSRPTRSTSTRPGRRSTRPATRTPTATASASTRASRSSCASTHAPSRPRARTAASSSPAGSRRSAWTSTTR